jgi:type VI secretion system secreted protein VgrG
MADDFKPVEFLTDAPGVQPFDVELVEGSEEISSLYSFSILLRSKQKDVKLEDMVRNKARLTVKVPVPGGGKMRLKTAKIHGVLASFEELEMIQDRVRYRATLVPRFWKTTLTVQSRVFLNKSVVEIVKEVLEAEVAGKKLFTSNDYKFKTSKTYPKREYVVQYQESDFDFINRWLEGEGIFYFWDQTEDGDILTFADDPAAYLPMTGDPQIPYRTGGGSKAAGKEGSETATEETITAFVARQQSVPSKVVLSDYNYRTPTADLKGEATVDSKDDGLVYEFGEHYKTSAEGKDLAKVRAQEIKCRQRIYLGASECRGFRPGLMFTMKDHFRFDGKYLLTHVKHVFKQDISSVGHASGALAYKNEFTCIPSDVLFTPERRTEWPEISGYTTGTVDAAGDGKYAELDDDGRYKIKLHLDLSDRKSGNASRAMRMAQPYGGNNMGFHSPQHKGVEVLLAHAEGNPDRPVILSTIPNPAHSSMVMASNQTQCEWKSGGNNEIRFEDTEGSEQVYHHAQKDLHTVVEHDELHQIKNNQTIEVTADRSKTVNGNQKEHVVKDKTILIDGNHSETITKDKTLTVTGSHTETIAKDVTITEGAKKTETIASDSTESVGASKAETIASAKSLTIGAAYQVSVGAAMDETIGAAKAMEIGADYSQSVGGKKEVAVGGDLTQSVKAKKAETIGDSFTLEVGKKLSIDAAESITLKSGDASITLKKDGTIEIKGKDIQLQGSGKITLKADSDISMKGSKIAQN